MSGNNEGSNNSQLVKKLKEITETNFEKLKNEGVIFKDEEIKKHFNDNKILECLTKKGKTPIPINVIFRALYDPDTKCQLSKGKLNLRAYLQEKNKDYDIVFTKEDYDINEIPNLYKMPINEATNFFNGKINEEKIKENLEDYDSYPKIAKYRYVYQHPMPNPVFMGPKLLKVDDFMKIIFLSPICFLIEITGNNSGFTMMDTFYTAVRYKFEIQLKDDLTISKTILNSYFGINFTKSCWLQSKIETNGMQQAEEGITGKYIPTIEKELELTMKKYSLANTSKKISMKKGANTSFTSMDTISNDSFISEMDTPFPKDINSPNIGEDSGLLKNSQKNLLSIFIILMISSILYLINKKLSPNFSICLAASLIIYLLIEISRKLDKLCHNK